MCDTFAVKYDGAVWFGKNSDREAAEPQRVEHHPAVHGDEATRLKCTYIEIEQVPDRHAVIVSRPDWMWGAEMGVNAAGVVIGNEAVFSRSILRRGAALLGMDLVRLGLERAGSASMAVGVIIDLLEQYGQGGPAGFRDKNFRYDNSFLIADGAEIFALESAGRDWAVKQVGGAWSISNTYSITDDFDRASAEFSGGDFKAAHEQFLMPRLACASARRRATAERVEKFSGGLAALAETLRSHDRGDGFDRGSNRDVCMHANGGFRPHGTTASMIVRAAPDHSPIAAFTGASNPCVSLFRPIGFLMSVPPSVSAPDLWERSLRLSERAAKNTSFRHKLRGAINQAEDEIFSALDAGDVAGADEIAKAWSMDWLS